MKNKKLGIGILATLSLATAAGLLFGLSGNAFSLAKGTVHDANCEWNHYEEVEPTYVKHGSKEFWACCTHPGEFELTEPASGNITDRGAFSGEFFENLDPLDGRYVERAAGNRFIRMDAGSNGLSNAILYTTAQYSNVSAISFKVRLTGGPKEGKDPWWGFGISEGHGIYDGMKTRTGLFDGEWHDIAFDSINLSGYVNFIQASGEFLAGTTIDLDDVVITHGSGTAEEDFEGSSFIFTLNDSYAELAGEALPSGPMNSFARMDVIGWQDSALLYSTAQYTNVTKVTFRFRHTGETFSGLWKGVTVNTTHSAWNGIKNFNETNDGKWHEVSVESINASGYVAIAYNLDHVINATIDVDDIVIFHEGGVASEDFEDDNNCLFTFDASHARRSTEAVGNVSLGVVALNALETTVEQRKGYASTFDDSTNVDVVYGPYVQLDNWQCASDQKRCWIGMTQTRTLAQIKTDLGSDVISNYFFYVYNPLETSFVLNCMLLSSSGTNPNTNITLAPKAWTRVSMAYGLTDNGSYPALTEAHQIGFDHTFGSNGAVIGSGWKITSIYATGPVNYYVRIDAGTYSSGDAPIYSNDQYTGITSVTFNYRVNGAIKEGKGGWFGIGIDSSHDDYKGLRTINNDPCDGEWHTKTFDLSGSPVDGYVNMCLACGEFEAGTTIDFDNIIIVHSGGTTTESFQNGYNSFTYKGSHASEIHLIEQ